MKRYISLICIFCLLVMFVAKPISVSASSFDPVQQPLNDLLSLQENLVLSKTTINNSVSYDFDLDGIVIGYLEFLVFASSNLLSADVNGLNCNISRSGLYYRIYCSPNEIFSPISLTLHFDAPAVCYLSSAQYSDLAHFSTSPVNCEIHSFISDVERVFNFSGSILKVYTSQSDFLDNYFTAKFFFRNVELFDYLNLSLKFNVWSIDSVVVSSADTVLIPFELSYLDVPSNPAFDSNDAVSDVYMRLCLDLSSLDLSRTDTNIVVTISGSLREQTGNYAYLEVLGIHGFILTSPVNPVIFWFRKTYHGLHTWFDSLLAVLQNIYNGNTAPGNSFQQQVDQKDQQLEDMAAVMESVDQPDLNSVNVSANSFVNGTVLAASMSGITSVFSEGLFFDVIVMSIMMATAGYVLFGKR